MKKVILTIVCGLGLYIPVSAQIDSRDIKEHVILKFMPLGAFDIDNTVQVGVEIPFKNNRYTFQQEVGYGHTAFNVWYQEIRDRPDKSTFKTRTQLRYYFADKRWGRPYIAGELLFKRVEHLERRWVGQACVSGECGYFEDKNIRFARFVGAGNFKVGWQFYFSSRVTLDVYTGLGLRYIEQKVLTKNAGNATQPRDTMLWDLVSANQNGIVIPGVASGFSIGIALGKFKER